MATKMVVDMVNKEISQKDFSIEHPLEWTAEARAADYIGAPEAQADASWYQLPSEQRSATTANVDIYLGDFISLVQVGPKEKSQILSHLFSQIEKKFRPKEATKKNK